MVIVNTAAMKLRKNEIEELANKMEAEKNKAIVKS